MNGSPYTLFFDARCGMCRMCRECLLAGMIGEQLWSADTRDLATAAQLGVSDPRQLASRMCLLTPEGEFWGYEAAVELLRLLPSADIANVLSRPTVARVGRWLYEQVAKRRSCMIGCSDPSRMSKGNCRESSQITAANSDSVIGDNHYRARD